MKPSIRTDLALEARELAGEVPGVRFSRRRLAGMDIDSMLVETDEGAAALGKPVGRYVTAEIDRLLRRRDGAFADSALGIGTLLREFLPLKPEDSVLIACLGNSAVTPDAIGPKCAASLLTTRHLKRQLPETFGGFREVSVVCPGVLGTTGIESAALVAAAVRAVQPSAVIAVDALASRSMRRLCRTVQICDTGIAPGSGVGNQRQALNQETLGVPVLAVGVPTVVDAVTLAADLTGADAGTLDAEPQMIVTPREIDAFVSDAAKLVGYAINLALQEHLSIEDLELLIS